MSLEILLGTSLVDQWLGPGASTAGLTGSIPGRGTKIPHVCGVAKKRSSSSSFLYEDFPPPSFSPLARVCWNMSVDNPRGLPRCTPPRSQEQRPLTGFLLLLLLSFPNFKLNRVPNSDSSRLQCLICHFQPASSSTPFLVYLVSQNVIFTHTHTHAHTWIQYS